MSDEDIISVAPESKRTMRLQNTAKLWPRLVVVEPVSRLSSHDHVHGFVVEKGQILGACLAKSDVSILRRRGRLLDHARAGIDAYNVSEMGTHGPGDQSVTTADIQQDAGCRLRIVVGQDASEQAGGI